MTTAQAELILETAAIPLPASSRMVKGSNRVISEIFWDDNASGSGIITADAALDLTSEYSNQSTS